VPERATGDAGESRGDGGLGLMRVRACGGSNGARISPKGRGATAAVYIAALPTT
jgi:hypothetical protein